MRNRVNQELTIIWSSVPLSVILKQNLPLNNYSHYLKVSQLLLLVESGAVDKWQGKKLSEIPIKGIIIFYRNLDMIVFNRTLHYMVQLKQNEFCKVMWS